MYRFGKFCAIIIGLSAFCEDANAQYLSNGSSYYSPRVASALPALSSAQGLETVEPEAVSGNEVLGGNCCQPLIPTIAQGIRDTLRAVFPCWGVRRPYPLGSRLLISERFYHGGISSGCGCGHSQGGVIYGGESIAPTPVQEMPATPEVDESAIRQQYLPGFTPGHLRNSSVLSSPVVIESNTIRSQSPPREILIKPAGYTTSEQKRSSNYPSNPLRD